MGNCKASRESVERRWEGPILNDNARWWYRIPRNPRTGSSFARKAGLLLGFHMMLLVNGFHSAVGQESGDEQHGHQEHGCVVKGRCGILRSSWG